MKYIKYIKSLTFKVLISVIIFSGCGIADDDNGSALAPQTYTCSMHPQIILDHPGVCPLCGMDLVPFKRNSAEEALHLNEDQITLANVNTITVGIDGFNTFKQLNGRLVVNPEKTEYISGRVAGRLEHLYVRQTGEKIVKGQTLYQLYSEHLASLQQEYILAVIQAEEFPNDPVFSTLLKSSAQKLTLYGQSKAQINALKMSRKTSPLVTYSSPASGVVAELLVSEGQYISEGTPLMRLEGYQSLWVEADIYPSEMGDIRNGSNLKVVIPGWEDRPQMTTVNFLNPTIETGSQLIKLRAVIPNPDGQWQPGLQANIYVSIKSKGDAINRRKP